MCVQGFLGFRDKVVVQCLVEAVILFFGMEARDALRHVGLMEHSGEIQSLGLPVRDACAHVEQVAASDQVLELANSHLRHQFAHFFGNEEEIVHHVFRLAGEFLAQRRVLCGHADRAGIKVAFAHHDAAFDHQRCGGKAEFVRAQQRADQHVATGLQLAVNLQTDATAQLVQYQRLLRFGQAQFPWCARMLHGRQRRCTGAAVIAGDHDMIGLGFGHARSHGTDTDFRYQLHGNGSSRIGVLQVVDELGEVFNGINIVVRRRRNQADAGHRVTQLADVFGHFGTGQLAAFAGLGALRHLDLDLVGTGEVLRRNTETAGRNLLDARTQRVARLHGVVCFDAVFADNVGQLLAAVQYFETVRIFAALAGVGLATDAVHGNGQCGMRFGRDRSQRHGAGGETFDDFLCRLDFGQRDWRSCRLDLKQAAQRHLALRLVVDELGVFLVGRVIVGARRMLQLGDGIRRPGVFFAADTVGIFAACIQHVQQYRIVTERGGVRAHGFFRYFGQADTFDLRCSAGEIFLDEFSVEPDCFEDLRTAIRLVCGDAHLGHHLEQALVNGLDEAFLRFLCRHVCRQFQSGETVVSQPRIHCLCAVTGEQGNMVHFTCGARFNHQAGAGAPPCFHKMMVHCRSGQQGRDGYALVRCGTVGQDEHVEPACYCLVGSRTQCPDGGLAASRTVLRRIGNIQHFGFVFALGELVDAVQFGCIFRRQHRLLHLQARGRFCFFDAEQIRLGTDEGSQRHHNFFADRVDRRIGHLRKQLLEIVVKNFALV